MDYDPSGLLFYESMVRVTFIIDGFNLYHSVRDAAHDLGGVSTKWLDIRSLCSSYIYLLGKTASLHEIHYFSALATHLEASDPDVTRRHRSFIRCLQATGVIAELNRFKRKSMRCPSCKHNFYRREEKETDVALAVKLLELFVTDSCDTVVLVTGDTDLAPAVRTAKQLFSNKKVIFAFPYKRKNQELVKLAPGSFEIKKEQYVKHQFPNPYVLLDGSIISKPTSW
ncbi:NYN domain-containing protein [Kovacikia minuta CCNUW1]|uniref:NYN domain-containing protein n=1 Tax=Kovacikia minuta TaxID=2931930 RepID=UPI001CCDA4BB|nr:NYN domain-containing protein [Kovacikia minuta]UBF27051.1 NYN domain-containing protein [Kovacikia minuta CCNUW1]